MKQRLFGFILGGAIAIWAGLIFAQGKDPLGLIKKGEQAIILLVVGLGICGITILWGIAQKVISVFRKPPKESQKPPPT